MPPALRFFERLAPAAPHGTASVQAAFPSRFETRSGAAARGGLAPEQGLEEETIFEPVPRTRAPHAQADVDALPSRVQAVDTAIDHAGGVRRDEQRADVHDPSRAAAALPQAVRASAPTTRQTDAAEGNTAVPRPTRDERAVLPVVTAARATGRPPLEDLARRPLREQVHAHRVMAREDASPTIVHVTIDRVDIRAPAMHAPPERAPVRPRGGSWKSLDDYLRQRTHATGDGA